MSLRFVISVQGRSNEIETGPAEVRRKNVKRRAMAGLAKPDKPCAARPFSSWGSGHGGRCKPPRVRGRAPEAFENFTLSHHKVDWFLTDLSLESASIVAGLFSF